MVFDFHKHLTTLSSGSILLILALAENFIKEPELSQHLFQSVFLFCVAILAALLSMGTLAFHASDDKPSLVAVKVMVWATIVAGLCFFAGITLVGLTVLRVYP